MSRRSSNGPSDAWRATLRQRALVCAVVMGLWTGALEARLVFLQVFQQEELQDRADRQRMRTIDDASTERGDILDRNGRLLAYSVDARSAYAVPNILKDPVETAARLCEAIEGCSPSDREVLEERLQQDRAFAWVGRQLSPAEARHIEQLDLEGVGFVEESQRFYPNRELAAHLLGFVGIDNEGLAGVEAAYDTEIRGTPGTILIQTDARRHAFSRVERAPLPGASIELTIDEYLQHVTERELRAGVAAAGAAGGMAIVMNPHTGEILAIANEPTFNPNDFAAVSQDVWRNRAVRDVFEPGSTFKLITASAALDEGVIRADDEVDTSPGAIRLGSRVIDDPVDYGVLSFTDVLARSSNVGAVKVGLGLGAERLSRYVRRFGFGSRLSPDFPGEPPGIVWPVSKLDEGGLASVSMGHQVSVTALQLVAAVSSIANGGHLMQPRVLRAVIRDGRRIAVQPQRIRTTVSPNTAAELTRIMEAVVQHGTGRRAAVANYRVAGKTGTANKIIDGRYSHTEYTASFVGFVPARRPALAITVVIDAPASGSPYRASTHGGGVAAAPVFKRIAELGLQHLGVPATVNPAPPIIVAQVQTPPSPVAPPSTAAARLVRPVPAVPTSVPDLRGRSVRESLRIVTALGMRLKSEGRGVVVEHYPEAGAPIVPGATMEVRLDRRPPGE